METIDLGYVIPNYGIPVATPEPKTKEAYPALNIPDKPELLRELNVGDTITATVKMRVTSVRESAGHNYESGCSIEFDVLSMAMEGKPKQNSKSKSASEALDEYYKEKK